jgi:hypothetical protein
MNDLLAHVSATTRTQLVMFVSGPGIATARALLEATNDSYGLNIASRKQVKVYYKVSRCVLTEPV